MLVFPRFAVRVVFGHGLELVARLAVSIHKSAFALLAENVAVHLNRHFAYARKFDIFKHRYYLAHNIALHGYGLCIRAYSRGKGIFIPPPAYSEHNVVRARLGYEFTVPQRNVEFLSRIKFYGAAKRKQSCAIRYSRPTAFARFEYRLSDNLSRVIHSGDIFVYAAFARSITRRSVVCYFGFRFRRERALVGLYRYVRPNYGVFVRRKFHGKLIALNRVCGNARLRNFPRLRTVFFKHAVSEFDFHVYRLIGTNRRGATQKIIFGRNVFRSRGCGRRNVQFVYVAFFSLSVFVNGKISVSRRKSIGIV